MKCKMLIIILIILAFVFAYRGIVFANDRIAQSLKDTLLAHPLPPETVLVDSKAVAGKMTGNGNGMQYYGMLLVKTALTEEELAAYYRDTLETEYGLFVDEQKTQMISDWYADCWFEYWLGGGGHYRVTLYRDSVAGCEDSLWEAILNMDLRGH